MQPAALMHSYCGALGREREGGASPSQSVTFLLQGEPQRTENPSTRGGPALNRENRKGGGNPHHYDGRLCIGIEEEDNMSSS